MRDKISLLMPSLKASKFSTGKVTPAACECPPKVVNKCENFESSSKRLTSFIERAEPLYWSPLLVNRIAGNLNSSTSLAAAMPRTPASQFSPASTIAPILLKSVFESIDLASLTTVSQMFWRFWLSLSRSSQRLRRRNMSSSRNRSTVFIAEPSLPAALMRGASLNMTS